MLTSDRATHLKVGMTAVLATVLVIVIGVYAKPAGGVHGQVLGPPSPAMAAMVDQGSTVSR
jgi:hypothetical protein